MFEKATSPLPRLVSLDAYRGFIMLVLASGGFALAEVAKNFPDSPLWQFLGYEFEHVPWTGCSFWDLIQPSFMFMVGAAIPYSHASRIAKGQSALRIAAHVIYRSVVLILLGVFLASTSSSLTRTHFIFTNVLAQIGLGYVFVYLLVNRSFAFQLLIVLVILAGYWYVFFNQPVQSAAQALLTSTERDRELWFPGTKAKPPSLYAHWNKNANFAAEVDQWFLNLFPQQPGKSFRFDEGGYQTLNFIPSMATMIFGLMAGRLLRSARRPGVKFLILFGAGALCLVIGLVLNETICPSVKRIWTPSWAVYSAGWTFWMLAGFYLVIDILGFRLWAFPLVVVGMNSIAMYLMSQLLKPWTRDSLTKHIGSQLFGGPYGPIVQSVAVLAILWLICLWMYRRGIFLRI
jgi:predicted acyltransferase